MIILLRKWKKGLPVLISLVLFACAHQRGVIDETNQIAFVAVMQKDCLINRYAPVFLTDGQLNPYDRIGRPSSRYEKGGKIKIYVDPESPAIYIMKRKFITKNGCYTNLIYRVHFSETPFKFLPFYLTAGKNVGLMVIITLDNTERPVLVTTVHTCGCYLAIIPTSDLPPNALPKRWKQEPLKVYGERLPCLLDYATKKAPKLLVRLRSSVHRVMDLEIVEEQEFYSSGPVIVSAELIPIEELENLPLNGGTTSFYHHQGLRKGHVKGAIKPWESLLLSLISIDFYVGMDKAYADTEKTGNPFYTSLKPWNRKKSDMWNFERFLVFWGWRL